jgi:hypothetical protein
LWSSGVFVEVHDGTIVLKAASGFRRGPSRMHVREQ